MTSCRCREGKLDWTKLKLADLAPSRFVALRHQVGADFSPPFAVPDLVKSGVIFCDFATALRQHPQLIEKYFMTSVVPARSSKFAALHAAFWTHGTFLYVPAGVELKMPLRTEFCAAGKNAAHFAHTLIVVERHAKLTYLDHYKSATEEGQGLFDGVTEIILGEGANLVYVAEQQWGRHVWDVSTRRAVLARDANLTWLNLGLGSAASKLRLDAILDGAGASAELLGITVAQPGQTVCYDTLQDHRVPYTKSDLLFKAAVKGDAHTAYEGTIRSTKARRRPMPIRPAATSCSGKTRAPTPRRSSRSRRTTCAARTARRSARWTRSSFSTCARAASRWRTRRG